jgi:hypothetical protein
MRQAQKFLLTVLLPEEDSKILCGKIKYILTGEEKPFSNLDEMASIIRQEIEAEKEGIPHPAMNEKLA